MRAKLSKMDGEKSAKAQDVVDKIIQRLEQRKCDALTYLHKAKRVGIDSPLEEVNDQEFRYFIKALQLGLTYREERSLMKICRG